MPYTLPQFNVTVNVWLPPHVPSSSAPDIGGVDVQIYVPSRMEGIDQYPGLGIYAPPIIFRAPRATLPHAKSIVFDDGAVSPLYFKVIFVQEMHIGFANAYDAFMTHQCNADGTVPRNY